MASKRISRLIKILTGVVADAEDGIFQLEGRMERMAYFGALVVRQFVRHRCLVRASALSYSTLLALIPLLAVALGITSLFVKNKGQDKLEQTVERLVSAVVPPAVIGTNVTVAVSNGAPALATNFTVVQIVSGTNGPEVVTNMVATDTNIVSVAEHHTVVVTAQKEITQQIWGFVQKTKNGTLGATGMVLLLLAAIMLLGRIEETFNDIWGVTRGRSWLRQIQLYCTTIMFGPLLLVAALGLAGGAQFQSAKDYVTHTPVVGKLVFDFLPLLVMWLAFALMYLLMPNTKVKFSAALVGGAVAGGLWHLNNLFGFLYVSRVVSNSQIYGKLGLVPVFMIGIYFSWVILLLGAEIAYAFQNRVAYLQDRLADNVNQRGREFVALRLMTCLGQRFQKGERPATVLQLSTELGIPSRLTQSVLRILCVSRLATEVSGSEAAFVPARPLETISAHDILQALRTGTGQELPLLGEPDLAEIYGEFARIEQAERVTAAAITLHALVNRLPAALPAPADNELKSAQTEPAFPSPADPVKISPPAELAIREEPAPIFVPAATAVSETSAPMPAPAPEPAPTPRPVARPSETDFPL